MDSRPAGGDADDMRAVVDERVRPIRERQRISRTPTTALFWRLFGFTAVVFVAGAAILVLSPATVSTPIVLTEVAVLAVGSVLMLSVNGVLLQRSLRPLDGLTALMERVDLLRPGQRLSVSGDTDVAHLIRTFNEMLDRLEHERGESTGHALAAQEGERQRIARELHDEIGQSLTAVLLGLKRTIDRAPTDLRDELCTVQEMVRSSLDEVRMVARRLRPGVLQDLGLPSALNALAADFAAASGVPLTPRLDPQLPTLSDDAELVVYRIAQEGLTNIARHAGATAVDLSVRHQAGGRHQPRSVLLTLTDDGQGLGGSPEGAGIRGMRERSILIGAELTLVSPTTGGTVLRLEVPIDAKGHLR